MISLAKMLARIPDDKLDWKPHEKSMMLGKLAAHACEIPGYIALVIDTDERDVAASRTPLQAESSAQLVKSFQEITNKAIEKLNAVTDLAMYQNWTLRNGEHVIFAMPRVAALRSFVFSHMIHHRGQLSVYLRMLDIPVPSIYGPSADEAA